MKFKRIAVYCGSSNQLAPQYFDLARELGRVLAHRGIEVVYGGGRVGLMGAVADATLEAGGRGTGVIPRKLDDLELGHRGIQDLFIVEAMHGRKAMMMHLSDGFISLPGGFGTLEELSEVVSLGTLNFHHKPVGILDQDGFYDHLMDFIEHARRVGFIREQQGAFLQRATDPAALIDAMADAIPQDISQWL